MLGAARAAGPARDSQGAGTGDISVAVGIGGSRAPKCKAKRSARNMHGTAAAALWAVPNVGKLSRGDKRCSRARARSRRPRQRDDKEALAVGKP